MQTSSSAGKVTVTVRDRSEPAVREFPRENLVRANFTEEIVLRDNGSTAADAMPTLTGHFAVFNEWTEINSSWEGRFMERVAPGAFDKTMSENTRSMRVLFDHGKDPSIGNKVLGPIDVLRADERGAYYEVPLFNTSYNKDLLPGLQAGSYGSSFRFKVMREDVQRNPERSEHNPEGIQERTILEAKVMEFGPVAFPAYSGATAGVRSLTDEYILSSLAEDPEKLAELLARLTGQPNAPSTDAPAEPPVQQERRVVNRKFNSREDYLEWLSSLS